VLRHNTIKVIRLRGKKMKRPRPGLKQGHSLSPLSYKFKWSTVDLLRAHSKLVGTHWKASNKLYMPRGEFRMGRKGDSSTVNRTITYGSRKAFG